MELLEGGGLSTENKVEEIKWDNWSNYNLVQRNLQQEYEVVERAIQIEEELRREDELKQEGEGDEEDKLGPKPMSKKEEKRTREAIKKSKPTQYTNHTKRKDDEKNSTENH